MLGFLHSRSFPPHLLSLQHLHCERALVNEASTSLWRQMINQGKSSFYTVSSVKLAMKGTSLNKRSSVIPNLLKG